MSIKQKIRSAWNKVTGKQDGDSAAEERRGCNSDGCNIDSELAAEEVIREEVFPAEKPSRKKTCKKCGCARKPASKRTRPTNNNYEMIDPTDNTCDTGKS